MDRWNEGSEDSQKSEMILVDTGGTSPERDGYTQGHLRRRGRDVLIRVPQNRYFCTRCREISMMKAHSAEKQLKKSLILREKRLDYLGREFTPVCKKPLRQSL